MSHRISVPKGQRKMATMIIRGDKLYLDYYVDNRRYKKSTGLANTSENRRTVKNVIIPQLLIKIATGEIYKKKPQTFKYYGEIFLQEKSKTLKGYLSREPYFLRVIEYFGNRDISKITRLDIKRYYSTLKMRPTSKGSYRSCINGIFEYAMDDGVINFNPALNISLGKSERHEIQYFKKEEVLRLLENAEGIMKPYLYIAFNTGMRPEEVLGLQYGDIKDNIITISRVRTKGRTDTPKTKNSYRKLHISNIVLNEIERLKATTKSLFLFGDYNDIGKLRRRWETTLKKANVNHKKISCARHTFATHMIKDEVVSISEVSGLLGHSSVKVTLTHYASVIDALSIDLGKEFSLYGEQYGNNMGTVESKGDKIAQ